MPKFKIKYKYNIGDEVILKDYPYPGWCLCTRIASIEIEIHEHWHKLVYVLDSGRGSRRYHEEDIESIEEFNKRQRENCKDYKSYINWLNTHDFTEED